MTPNGRCEGGTSAEPDAVINLSEAHDPPTVHRGFFSFLLAPASPACSLGSHTPGFFVLDEGNVAHIAEERPCLEGE